MRNYNWPCYKKHIHQDSYKTLNLTTCTNLYNKESTLEPYYTYHHKQTLSPNNTYTTNLTSSTSNITFYNNTMFPPTYTNNLFFTNYSHQYIWFMQKNTNNLPNPTTLKTFTTGSFPIDLQIGPNNALYYPNIISNEIHQITYNKPTTTISINNSKHTFNFHSSNSVSYTWDFNNNQHSTQQNPTHTYTKNNKYTMQLRMTNAHNTTNSASTTIQINTPPNARILTPAPNTT